MIGAFSAELRYARRSLLRTPATTTAAVACLAGAIAAATGIFAIVNGVVLRGLPFRALGATSLRVVGLIMREGAMVVAAGIAAGLAIAWWAARLLTSLLYGVAPHDPPMIGMAAALSAAVGLIAVFVPALRATRVDPLVALRDE